MSRTPVYPAHVHVTHTCVPSTPACHAHLCTLQTCVPRHTCVSRTPVYPAHLYVTHTCVPRHTCVSRTPVYPANLCTQHTCMSCTPVYLGTPACHGHLHTQHTCIPSTPACHAHLRAGRQPAGRHPALRGHWGDEAPQQGPPSSTEVPSSASPHLLRPGGVAQGFKGLEHGQVWGQVPGQRWPWKGAPSEAGAPWMGGERSWQGSGLPAGVPFAAESRLPPATHTLQDAEPVLGSGAGRCAPRVRMGRWAPCDARP